MRVYQLKITILGIKPIIWRQVKVPEKISFVKLHEIIQKTFNWLDRHKYQFIIDNEVLGLSNGKKLEKIKIDKYFVEGKELLYLYDLDDKWEHEIIIEKIIESNENEEFPMCIDGVRNGPPEDIGGVLGYEDMMKIISDPEDEEFEDMLEYLEGVQCEDFDPEYFSIAEINEKYLFKVRS